MLPAVSNFDLAVTEVSMIDACEGSSCRSSKYDAKEKSTLFSLLFTLCRRTQQVLSVSAHQLSHIHCMLVTGHPLYTTVAGRQIPDSFTIIRKQNSDYLAFILQAWL